MRIETTTRNLYTFDELTETAKENAVNNLRGINVDYEWWQSTYDDAEMVGIKITEFDLDHNRYAKGKIADCIETAQLILKNHGETCETYKTATAFLKDYLSLTARYERIDDILIRCNMPSRYMRLENELYKCQGMLEDMQDDFRQSIIEDYSVILQKEFEYLTSDAIIIETIQANEYGFTENGKWV